MPSALVHNLFQAASPGGPTTGAVVGSDTAVDQADPRLLFVPVDAFPASERALAMAMQLARRGGGRIVLVGILLDAPTALAIEPDERRALRTAAEYGAPAPVTLVARDDDRLERLLWNVLLPLQRRVQASGTQAVIRVLRGDAPADQLRGILAEAPQTYALALSNPLILQAPLCELTVTLLVQPPCTTYVTGLSPQLSTSRWRIITRLLEKIWHPRVH